MRILKNMLAAVFAVLFFAAAAGFKLPVAMENEQDLPDFKFFTTENQSLFDTPPDTPKTPDTQQKKVENDDQKKDFIKWVDFNAPYPLLKRLYQLQVKYHGSEIDFNFCQALSYLSVKNGNKFNAKADNKNLDALLSHLKNGEKMSDIISGKYYDYFLECYQTIFKGFFAEYTEEKYQVNDNSATDSLESKQSDSKTINDSLINVSEPRQGNTDINTDFLNDTSKAKKEDSPPQSKFGLTAYYPFAYGYWCSHYDDFGNSRSFGYKRKHLGHDMFGAIGTPIVAIEGGTVKELGWNRYGGWRVGILSADGKRYYYYAHLRKNHPFAEGLETGKTVAAGEVIGYLGMTGYSNTENVNLKTGKPHLHIGLQLIFDESQIKGSKEIWIDLYPIINLLSQNKAKVMRNQDTKEYKSIHLKKPAYFEY